jgi:hypothetical protein
MATSFTLGECLATILCGITRDLESVISCELETRRWHSATFGVFWDCEELRWLVARESYEFSVN